MADRTAQTQTGDASVTQSTPRESSSPAPPAPITSRAWGGRQSVAPPPDPSETISALRTDLMTAQQSRLDLQARLDTATKELNALKTRSKTDVKRIAQLTAEVNQLTVKMRDRDEELKGKSKLLDDMQDEVVTLNMQLNVADEKGEKLRMENQELVDRWMESKRKEAEKMNEGSRYS